MALNPSSEDDGPIKVIYSDGTPAETWDRFWQMDCGMIHLFDIETERTDHGSRYRKGENAKSVPVRRIERLEFLNYGP